jgi:hypothetical protein
MVYKRICPQCKKELIHKNKASWKYSMSKKKICLSCSCKNKCKTEEQKKQMASRLGGPKNGKDNPFYGKTHSDKTKKILAEKCGHKGNENGMYGRAYHDVWIEKYGKEEADRREVARSKKMSMATSGENNPMYGKPSPQGSGNGWSGWYKGWFFRSLGELSYMVNVIEKNNFKWVSAESKKFAIPYIDWNGKNRNYFPDFFVNDKILVEVKPKRLKNSASNILKAAAAEKFCKDNGYEYEVTEAVIMKEDQILDMYNKNLIKFMKRYEEKFKERYLNGKKD